jgi:branched-chain amino acid transport system permease protein
MRLLAPLKKSAGVTLWFTFLAFPFIAIKVNPYERTVEWRWQNLLYVALAAFICSVLGSAFLHRKKVVLKAWQLPLPSTTHFRLPVLTLFLLALGLFPRFVSSYQINIMITALLYVMLGLGLNIVVGMAGLLDLGYVAFYAVGAYSYALLNLHFSIGFWTALPIGGLLAAAFGILLGFPVLRLRGDYLAIVTLGFGEIIRLILENWTEFLQGPSGISGIPRPGFFGMKMTLDQSVTYLYYLMIIMVMLAVFATSRLQNSRIGRA